MIGTKFLVAVTDNDMKSKSIENHDTRCKNENSTYESGCRTENIVESNESINENSFVDCFHTSDDFLKQCSLVNCEETITLFPNFENNELVHKTKIIDGPSRVPEIKIKVVSEMKAKNLEETGTVPAICIEHTINKSSRKKKKKIIEKSATESVLKYEDNPKKLPNGLKQSESTLKRSSESKFIMRRKNRTENSQKLGSIQKSGKLKRSKKSKTMCAPTNSKATISVDMPFMKEKIGKSTSLKANVPHKKHTKPRKPLPFKSRNSSQSLGKLRPYMMDAQTRRKAKDFGTLCKCNRLLNPRSKTDSFFVLKYVSSDFEKGSEQSLSDMPSRQERKKISTASSCIISEDKYRTEPKNSDIEMNRKIKGFTIDMAKISVKNHVDYSKKQSINVKHKLDSIPIFERLKGDERDLPGAYSRFVRRTKCSKNSVELLKTKNKIKKDSCEMVSSNLTLMKNEVEDYILGELIDDKPIDDRLLELINKRPFRYHSDEFSDTKIKKEKRKGMESGGKIRRSKESVGKESSSTLKRSSDSFKNTLTRSSTVKVKSCHEKNKSLHNMNMDTKKKDDIIQQNLERIDSNEKFSCNDLMKETVQMSPTATIAFMMLAANRKICERTEISEPPKRKNSFRRISQHISVEEMPTVKNDVFRLCN